MTIPENSSMVRSPMLFGQPTTPQHLRIHGGVVVWRRYTASNTFKGNTTMQNELNELRNQVRTLKRVVYGAFGLMLVGGLLAATSLQSVPDVVRAKSFEVVNGQGKVIVELGSIKGGGVDNGLIVTRTSMGGTLVRLGACSGGGTVATENAKGQSLVKLGVMATGEGEIVTQNSRGVAIVKIGATTEGNGVVQTQTSGGKPLVLMGVTTNGMGMVETQTGKGQSLVTLTVSLNETGAIATWDGRGNMTSRSP